ncbi:MAG: hypothetical protein GC192_17560 [Bacteroidetes bacterium]|nr:hypothetical protein [Bacteroidota bacterium]
MNDLEKYILKNRDELDHLEPVPEEAMWKKIRANSIPQKPPTRTGFNWKLLAIATLVLSVAGWGLLFFKKQATVPPVVTPPKQEVPIAEQPLEENEMPAVEQTVPIAARQPDKPTQEQIAAAERKVPPSIAKQPKRKAKRVTEEEAAAQTTIFAEEQELQQLVVQKQQEIGLDTLDRATYADLLKELDELEISVAEARRDLGGIPQQERLMETLIRYYELKIRILEQINYEINKQKYHEALEKRI